jgi:hypothetical protein
MTWAAQLPSGAVPRFLRGQLDTYQLLWPQRWSFFAAEDALATIGLYRQDADGRSYSAVDQSFTSERNTWGLGRRQYALFVEVVTIEQRVPAHFWHACDAPVTPALDGCAGPLAAAPFTLDNGRSWPALCGTFAFTHERAVPVRSGSATPAGGRRVVDVAVVRLTCDG